MHVLIDGKRAKLLFMFLMADFVFILLHIGHKFTDYLPDYMYNIEYDGGYAEMFQYIKEFWIVLLLLYLALKKSKLLYLGWTLLFLFILIDDAFQIHESIGGPYIGPWLSDIFGRSSRFGLKFKDYGELAVSAVSGGLFAIFIGLMHYKSEGPARKVSRDLSVMVALLVLFGVGLDMMHEHVWIQRGPRWVGTLFGMAEDAGEMFIMSFIACYVFNIRDYESKSFLVNQESEEVDYATQRHHSLPQC